MPDEAKMDTRPGIDRLRREMVAHGVSHEAAGGGELAIASSGIVELDLAMRVAKHALFQRARKLDPDIDSVDISFCIEQLQKVDELSPRIRGL